MYEEEDKGVHGSTSCLSITWWRSLGAQGMQSNSGSLRHPRGISIKARNSPTSRNQKQWQRNDELTNERTFILRGGLAPEQVNGLRSKQRQQIGQRTEYITFAKQFLVILLFRSDLSQIRVRLPVSFPWVGLPLKKYG
jgi:hypothetical protein